MARRSMKHKKRIYIAFFDFFVYFVVEKRIINHWPKVTSGKDTKIKKDT